MCVVPRHTEPGSGASTPDLDPYSPVDRKRASRGCTFVPDIQEIRVRSEPSLDPTTHCITMEQESGKISRKIPRNVQLLMKYDVYIYIFAAHTAYLQHKYTRQNALKIVFV